MLTMFAGVLAAAHCDSLDGPVVKAARAALAAGDVNLVLPWVGPGGEEEVKKAFARTAQVRKLNPEARELADTWFFETVVRVHRAGEGAPFEGLKPAGRDPGPAIAAAERAIKAGSAEGLEKHLTAAVSEQLAQRFERVLHAKKHKPGDVAAGRAFVAAYVDFIHFAERVHQAVSGGNGHAAEHEH